MTLPLIPHQKVRLNRVWENKAKRYKVRTENDLKPPVRFIQKFTYYDRDRKIDMNKLLTLVANEMTQVKGRQVSGLFLHYNNYSRYYSSWPSTNFLCYKVLSLEQAEQTSLEYLKDVDFVVVCVWGLWKEVTALLNAIDKPVFWCFNENVTTFLEVDYY